MRRQGRLLASSALGVLLGACAAPGSWWQKDLQAWEGAPVDQVLDAWGPPLRTLTDEAGGTVLVYDTLRELDRRIERLADPAARLDPDAERGTFRPVERSECTVFFELEADVVAVARYEGRACDIVPREPERRRADPTPARHR
jgi:hypothetical protein